jgi:hypothetical protein
LSAMGILFGWAGLRQKQVSSHRAGLRIPSPRFFEAKIPTGVLGAQNWVTCRVAEHAHFKRLIMDHTGSHAARAVCRRCSRTGGTNRCMKHALQVNLLYWEPHAYGSLKVLYDTNRHFRQGPGA